MAPFKRKSAATPQAPQPISVAEFWDWFREQAPAFHKIIETRDPVPHGFVDKLRPKLNALDDSLSFLAGMQDGHTAELVFTADGSLKNFGFIEALVAAAPALDGWLFTALKPPMSADIRIDMNGLAFSKEELSFYANENPQYPDDIDLTIVHRDWREDAHDAVFQGTCIFLENMLGEEAMATTIDNLEVAGPGAAAQERIPIEKLPEYLRWRQKEFVEKYEGSYRPRPAEERYSVLQGSAPDGKGVVAAVNSGALAWDGTAAYPWMTLVIAQYPADKRTGMPDEKALALIEELDADIAAALGDERDCIELARETGSGKRRTYLACRDFRKASAALRAVQQAWAGRMPLSYDIVKDKYWRMAEHYRRALEGAGEAEEE